jgi:hypothetical protein
MNPIELMEGAANNGKVSVSLSIVFSGILAVIVCV